MLYSIALKEVCNGPSTLRVDNSENINLKNLEVSVGDSVQIDNSVIKVGDGLIIDLDGSNLWVPQDLNITCGACENFKINLVILKENNFHQRVNSLIGFGRSC